MICRSNTGVKGKKGGGEQENEHRRVGTAQHVARVYTPNWIACLGLSDTWGNLTKSKLNWSAKWKPADWLSAQLSVNASPLGFYPLLQTLQNYYLKKNKTGAFLETNGLLGKHQKQTLLGHAWQQAPALSSHKNFKISQHDMEKLMRRLT